MTITRDFTDLAANNYEFLICDIAIFGEIAFPDEEVIELERQSQSAYLDEALVFTIMYENQIEDETTTYMELANIDSPLASFISIESFDDSA